MFSSTVAGIERAEVLEEHAYPCGWSEPPFAKAKEIDIIVEDFAGSRRVQGR